MAERPASARPPNEDGMDILKFFIAIMSFLTLLVLGMAVLNYTRVSQIEGEIEDGQATLELMKKLAANAEFRDLVAKDRASKDQVDVLKKDLGEHLQQTAARMQITLSNFEKLGAVGFKQQGFDKFSYRFVLDKYTLEVVTEYLFYLQLSWPGLKIEEIAVQEAQRAHRDDPFPGWKTTVLVSIYRPKA